MKPLLFVVLIFSLQIGFAQTNNRLPCVDKKFSVVAHIFNDSLGNPGITEATILDLFEAVNVDFAPICISFEVCEFQYHDNFQYDAHNRPEQWQEMQNLYHEENRINIYYVNAIVEPTGVCGYAGLGQITNTTASGIVIQKSGTCCTLTSKTHSHEMGHYFGLEHTFMDAGTNELADGSNCATAGDGICDTPADPFINGSAMALWLDGCRFISTNLDANGDYYDPIVGNIMSYYPDDCACGFTHEQYDKMAETYLSNPGQW
jgi:hypothetical protein